MSSKRTSIEGIRQVIYSNKCIQETPKSMMYIDTEGLEFDVVCTVHHPTICMWTNNVWLLCGYNHTAVRRMVSAYTSIYQMRCTAYKVAPEDGII